MRIVTDSRAPGEAKDAESSHLYTLYRAFATQAESAVFRKQLEDGMGWGDAKQALYEHLEERLAPMREKYVELIANPGRIEDILQAGADKARKQALPLMQELRVAVGLRNLNAGAVSGKPQGKKDKEKGARFVSFRDDTGGFRFRLLAADGEELLLSQRFADPKQAGALMRRLQSESADQVLQPAGEGYSAVIDGVAVAEAPAGVQGDAEARLARVREALASLAQE
ncbi:Tryptophan--tRNA ligase [compost metagenome]